MTDIRDALRADLAEIEAYSMEVRHTLARHYLAGRMDREAFYDAVTQLQEQAGRARAALRRLEGMTP